MKLDFKYVERAEKGSDDIGNFSAYYGERAFYLIGKYLNEEYRNVVSVGDTKSSLAYYLYLQGISLDHFSNLDFIKLYYVPSQMFKFVNNRYSSIIIETMSPVSAGRFFVILNEEYLQIWNDYSRRNGMSNEPNTLKEAAMNYFKEYNVWLMESILERVDLNYFNDGVFDAR